jgi:hypothetical protein
LPSHWKIQGNIKRIRKEEKYMNKKGYITEEFMKQLKNDLLTLFVDSNMKFIQTENDDEKFGALMTLGYGFKQVEDYFDENYGV